MQIRSPLFQSKQRLFLALLFLPLILTGQHLNFHHFKPKDGFAGLTDFEVQITQDRSGFLWIPTLNGLYRYDGQEFKVFKEEPDDPHALSTNIIRVVFEDSDGEIWVGTGNGIHIYHPETGYFEHLVHDPNDPESLCGNDVRSIGEDRDGNIWVGVAQHTACVYGKKEKRFVKKYQPAGDVGFLQQKDGTIWLSGGLGLFKYSVEKDSFLHYAHPSSNSPDFRSYGFVNLFEAPDGKIWGTSKRFWKGIFDPATSTYQEFPALIKNTPRTINSGALFQDQKGRVWFGGLSAVSVYDPGRNIYQTFRHLPEDPTSCPAGDITTIFQDRAGSMWFSSFHDVGLSVVHSPDNPFQALELATSDIVIFLDERHLLSGSQEGKKQVFDIETEQVVPFALPQAFVESKSNWMLHGPDNTMWWREIAGVSPKTAIKGFSIETGQLLTSPGTAPFSFDSKANLWYIIPKYFDRTTGEFIDYRDKIFAVDSSEQRKKAGYYHSMVDRHGRVWLGGSLGGLVRYDRKTGQVTLFDPDSRNPDAVVSGSVNLLFEASNGWIYILTANGMSVFQEENNRFLRLDLSEGRPQLNQVAVVEDDQNNIWLGLSGGLTRINGRNLSIQQFDESDGVPDGHFGDYFTKDAYGRIYFTKGRKPYRFDPRKLIPDTSVFPIVLTDFYLNHKRVVPGGKDSPINKVIEYVGHLKLAYTQSDFGFRFVSPDFKNADRLEYFYQLENYDKNWVNIGNETETHFTNIPHGNYKFKIKARTPAGKWTPEHRGIPISVRPAWWESWWFYFLAVILMAGLVFIWIYRLRKEVAKATQKIKEDKETIEQQAVKLMELDEAKSRFFTNISHEFRTPLTIISGMADQIKEKPETWFERGIKLIKQNTANLLNLVNQILELRKLESNELKVELEQGDVVKYLRYITESHQSYAANKGLQLHFLSAEPEINMDHDPEKLLRIVSNLLSNAIKFTPEGGNIYLHVDKKNHGGEPQFHLRVQDTGVGIPAEELPHIFRRFYQVDDSTTRKGEGTGIGMTLTRELVDLLGGEIKAESTVGQGTTFHVVLPITQKAEVQTDFNPKREIIAPSDAEPASPKPEIEWPGKDAGTEEKPTLLLVEDNPDVQQYLVACLGDEYQLTLADNGQTGIDLAIEQLPDLIVSDVMMPEKDGYELTEFLKNDERTNHIPIVLLTAKADIDSKISGLEKGADAYLAKPFDKRELLVRLEKLLELRKKLQARYAQFSFSENNQEKIEDPFLQKFYGLVEKEISNPDLDMNNLCRSLGMSRSQVFRKLKALTGKSATLFIRSIRLQHAKRLLSTTGLTVAEIAYEVGFTSPSYFSTAFLEEFGAPPSATRK